ncbi:non-canonical purine NTP pyrophosphatase [Terriglobus roseus]|uniref:dITP/XTP pyrophosphatase n=1 Tax=Terriglobus roseus TaxID=392734 RepID=A0A1H4KA97_9BACT|nr:non-canonical purine NTP pyrophosphatase [Terriglobus roseus]SEB55449.1 XTP/dITP diphosphohydrolase [Terriglobus roseus]
MTIYVATSNPGKLRDFRAAAGAYPGITIEPLPGLANIPAPAEDAPDFEGNARAKAIYYSKFAPGAWVMADDSGLEVDALEGRPGVRSARFSEDVGVVATGGGLDENNNLALTLAMIEQTNRAARYRCALALAVDGAVELVTFGKLEGEILEEPEGDGGFGYDPLFHVPELGCTMAQVGMEDRMRVSHRGRALASLLRQWRPC